MIALGNYVVICFGALFAVLSPLATVPPFLAMTESDHVRERLAMARRACLVAFSVLIVFSLTGLSILTFFGISVPAFKIAGGVLLLRASLEMVKGTRSRLSQSEQAEGVEKEDIAVTPLAIPLLCGPITIVTAILLSSRAVTWLHYPILIGTIATIYLLTYLCLRLAVIYSGFVGEITLRVVSRLMGLLLAAMAIQFVINGVRDIEFSTGSSPEADATSLEGRPHAANTPRLKRFYSTTRSLSLARSC